MCLHRVKDRSSAIATYKREEGAETWGRKNLYLYELNFLALIQLNGLNLFLTAETGHRLYLTEFLRGGL